MTLELLAITYSMLLTTIGYLYHKQIVKFILKNSAIRIMKKQILLTSIIGILALSFIISANGQVNLEINGMYEDQFLICDFREKCVIIDIDDYMDKKTGDNLYRLFNEDLDTFPLQALD